MSTGRNGSRNCRVIGRTRPPISSAARSAFTKGPGDALTDSEKISIIARIKYCPSYRDHGCICNERSVSAGEIDVSKAAMDVEHWRLRMREYVALHFLRMRCGMRASSIDMLGIFTRIIF